MKKWICLTAAGMLLSAMVSGTALAQEEEYLYGTMQIPYADFYAAEGSASEVDAVTSATASKWSNQELVAGTYYEAHAEDEGGDILGVVYPVAITQEELDALGDDNYNFTAVEGNPEAYKIVNVSDGIASFSAVQGETTSLNATAEITSESAYGDYQISVDGLENSGGSSSVGTIYGVLLTTDDGAVYGLRHLENIWQNELAWSVGFTVAERHGNELSSEDYADMMGKTITEITYITETGYHVLETELYLPVKFDGGIEVATADISAGSTAVTVTNLPEDFVPVYSLEGLAGEANETAVTYTDALPGSYTLTLSDESGVYAPVSADFVLTTEEMPVAYDTESGSIVPASGADTSLAEAFLSNISTVAVNGTEYHTSGHGAVAIITADGLLDSGAAVTQGRGEDAVTTPVFETSGDYEITVTSTGFYQPLTFTASVTVE